MKLTKKQITELCSFLGGYGFYLKNFEKLSIDGFRADFTQIFVSLREIFKLLSPVQAQKVIDFYNIHASKNDLPPFTVEMFSEPALDHDYYINFLNLYEKIKPDLSQADIDMYEKLLKDFQFRINVLNPFQEKIKPFMYELLRNHYPVLNKEKRKTIFSCIDLNLADIFQQMLVEIYSVVHDEDNNVDFKLKYPELDSWRDFYLNPKPSTVNDLKEIYIKRMSEEEWEKYRQSENEKMLIFHNWEQKRVSEFIGIVQSLLINLYPRIENLSSDGLILYVSGIRDAYERFKNFGEHIESFIDARFPAKYLNLDKEEYDKIYTEYWSENDKEISLRRKRRIAGEKI